MQKSSTGSLIKDSAILMPKGVVAEMQEFALLGNVMVITQV